MDLELADKVVLVTGASSGIGRATAVAFAREGASVVVGDHSNADGATATAAEVVAVGGRALPVQLDLGDEESINAVVRQVGRKWATIDVLVNNAVEWPGFPQLGELFETAPAARMHRSLRANLEGPYLLSRAVVADMRRNGWGRIVHISTGLVEDGHPMSSAYVTPKAALHGLAKVMSRELAAAGILTNVVMAGFVPAEKPFPAAVIEVASRAAAIARVSHAREIADLIVFLCSARNTNITGQAIRADGHFFAPMTA